MNAIVPTPSYAVSDIERMARAFAASKLFGVQNPEQALAMCLVAQAEGRHPASAAQDYHIISGRPAKKADAMLRDFLAAGGRVEWHTLSDDIADATFSHPMGGTARIDWTLERAKAAQISNPMWKKYPRQMLRSRVVSEGVRTVCPGATSGMYVPEEVQDFDDAKPVEVRDVTPRTEAKRLPSQAPRQAPVAENPVDRSAEIVPAPDTEDAGDWEFYRKVIATKINRAMSALEVGMIQTANADGLGRCGEILPDTQERIASFVDAKLAALGQPEVEAA